MSAAGHRNAALKDMYVDLTNMSNKKPALLTATQTGLGISSDKQYNVKLLYRLDMPGDSHYFDQVCFTSISGIQLPAIKLNDSS